MTEESNTGEYLTWPAKSSDLIEVTCWSGDEPVKTHKHQFIEIAFLAYGSCIHTYHGTDVRLVPGDMFIITPHEEHSYTINSKTVIYNCLFYPEALGEDWKKLEAIKSIYELLIVEPFFRIEAGRQEILHVEPSEVIYIEQILKKMLEEQEENRIGFELMEKANLAILLCILGRAWDKQLGNSKKLYGGKRELLIEAFQFIETNIGNELRIGEMASKVYLSPNYFRRIFKEVTGLTPIEYINKARISKACKLIWEKGATISLVAEAVGINDLNYFSRLFKAYTGYSPSEYKKKRELC
jgi:AraC-like DNA-binding protein